MIASPAGEVLSVNEAEGFNLRLKVYEETSISEKKANKRKVIVFYVGRRVAVPYNK